MTSFNKVSYKLEEKSYIAHMAVACSQLITKLLHVIWSPLNRIKVVDCAKLRVRTRFERASNLQEVHVNDHRDVLHPWQIEISGKTRVTKMYHTILCAAHHQTDQQPLLPLENSPFMTAATLPRNKRVSKREGGVVRNGGWG